MAGVARALGRWVAGVGVAEALFGATGSAEAQQTLESGRPVTIAIAADDPLLESHGPSSELHYKVAHNGFVYVWAASASCDPFLRISSESGEQITEDDNSGGGTTAFLEREVHADEELRIAIARAPGTGSNSIEVRLTAVPRLPDEQRPAVAAAIKLIEASDAARKRAALDEARANAKDAIEQLLAIPCSASREITATLLHAGYSAYVGQDPESALRAWDAVLRFRASTLPEEHRDLQRARGNVAAAMKAKGDLAGARAIEEQVLAVFERTLPAEHPDLQTARSNVAGTALEMGDVREARTLLDKVLAIDERTLADDHPALQDARQNLASTMSAMGDIPGARALEEKALTILERTRAEEDPDVQRARENLAITMSTMGDLPGALALQQKVLAIRERTLPEEHSDLQDARLNLAGTLSRMGDLRGARALEEQVVAVLERTLSAENPDLQAARENLAMTMLAMGYLPDARALEEKVVAILERTLPQDHRELQIARNNLAITMEAMGDLPEARALEEKVLAVFEGSLPAEHPSVRALRRSLCWTLVKLGEEEPLARELAALADSIARWSELARLQGRREALERIGSTELQVSTLLSLESTLGATGAGFSARVFSLIETQRAITAGSGEAGVDHAEDAATAELRGRVLELCSRVGDLVADSGSNDATRPDDTQALSRAIRERDAVEAELRRRLVASGRLPPPMTVQALAAALPERGAAAGFRRFTSWRIDPHEPGGDVATESLLVHVVRKDGTLTRVDLGAIAEIDRLVKEWRAAIGKPVERGAAAVATPDDAPRTTGEALRRAVLDPVLAAAGSVAEIRVCLDDALHLVPIEALPLGDGVVGDVIAIRYEIAFERLLMPKRATAREGPLVAFGGIDFDSPGAAPSSATLAVAAPVLKADRGPQSGVAFRRLADSGPEVKSIAACFQSVFDVEPIVLLGAAATKAAFHESAPRARFLHLATHGYFAPERVRSILDRPEPEDADAAKAPFAPTATKQWRASDFASTTIGISPLSLCGLAFAGANLGMDSHGRVPGILTAEELAGLDLRKCELAVLSACETNVGLHRAGLGIQSLQAALHAAGVRTVVTSLWTVNDEATLALMSDFYRRVWTMKQPKAEALWNAKLALRKRGAPVLDWAAWILTGDPE